MEPTGGHALLRSESGQLWREINGAPLADDPEGLAQLDDGTLAVLGKSRLWWSDDVGLSWTGVPLTGTFERIVTDGVRVYLGGNSGLAEAEPNQDLRVWMTEPLLDLQVAAGPDLVVVRWDGLVARGSPDRLEVLPLPPQRPQWVTMDTQAVYIANPDGVWWLGERWESCAGAPSDITRIAAANGRVYLTTSTEAVWVSDEACASFTLVPGLTSAPRGAGGGPRSPDDTFTGLHIDGDRLVVAGWGGLAISEDMGQNWKKPTLTYPDYTRGVAFAANGRVLLGGDGCGVTWTDDLGASIETGMRGHPYENVQDVIVDPEDGSRVLGIVNHTLIRSTDNGESWELTPLGGEYMQAIHSWSGESWALANRGWWRSEDLFLSASTYPGSEDLLAENEAFAAAARVVLDEVTLDCALVEPARVVCTEDAGRTWATLYLSNAADIMGLIAAGDALLVADSTGVFRSTDRGGTWTPVWEHEADRPALLVRGEEAHYLLTLAGAVWRSDRDGEAWQDLGLQIPSQPRVATHTPAGSELTPHVIIGTHDGVFLLENLEGEATLRRWAAWGCADSKTTWLTGECVDCLQIDTPDAVLGSMLAVVDGLSTGQRGAHFELDGVLPDEVRAVAALLDHNGARVAEAELTSGHGVLGRLDAEPGAYELIVETDAPGLLVDVLRAWEETPLLPVPAASDPQDSGATQVSGQDGPGSPDGEDVPSDPKQDAACGCQATGTPGLPLGWCVSWLGMWGIRRRAVAK